MQASLGVFYLTRQLHWSAHLESSLILTSSASINSCWSHLLDVSRKHLLLSVFTPTAAAPVQAPPSPVWTIVSNMYFLLLTLMVPPDFCQKGASPSQSDWARSFIESSSVPAPHPDPCSCTHISHPVSKTDDNTARTQSNSVRTFCRGTCTLIRL